MYWSKLVRTRFIRHKEHWKTGVISDKKLTFISMSQLQFQNYVLTHSMIINKLLSFEI